MANIYELTGELLSLMDKLYDEEINEDDLLQACEEVELAIEDKADGYAKILRNISADIKSIQAEERRLKERRQALEHRQAQLKYNLESSMRAIGKTKFKTDLFSFGIQNNPPSIKVEDSEAFIRWCQDNDREEFLKYKAPEVDKTALKEAIIKDGEIIDGVEVVQTEGLRIR